MNSSTSWVDSSETVFSCTAFEKSMSVCFRAAGAFRRERSAWTISRGVGKSRIGRPSIVRPTILAGDLDQIMQQTPAVLDAHKLPENCGDCDFERVPSGRQANAGILLEELPDLGVSFKAVRDNDRVRIQVEKTPHARDDSMDYRRIGKVDVNNE